MIPNVSELSRMYVVPSHQGVCSPSASPSTNVDCLPSTVTHPHPDLCSVVQAVAAEGF